MHTTLNKIRANLPCTAGWQKLLKNLGKTQADDEPLDIPVILESNGLDYALWCLSAVDGRDKEIRLFAVECARSVQHLMTDPRSIKIIDVAEKFARGQATQAELDDAKAAAKAAARAAARAAGGAWAASAAAAADAARDTAWAAAAAAARDTAWDASAAASAAAWDASRDQQAMYLLFICEQCKGGA